MSKKVMVLWFLVIFIMCATLVVIHYNTLDKRLIEIEKTLKVASRDYFRDNDMIDRYNEIAVRIARDNEVIINDLNKLTRNLPTDCYKDYCHFTEKTSTLLGKAVADKIKTLLETQED